MKKIICLLVLGASASVWAQKTVLTPNGEKLPYPPVSTNVLGTSGNTITSNVNGISATAPAVNSVDATLSGKTLTTTVNGVSDATPVDISIAEPWKVQGGSTNASSNTENIYQSAKVSIGGSSAVQPRLFTVYGDSSFRQEVNLNSSGVGSGQLAFGLTFGPSSGVGISSNRSDSAGENLLGIDLQTSDTKRLSIAQNGNVGINTVAPTAKLEVQGTVKIVDGTQAANSVLTSDANGLASWKPTFTNFVDGVRPKNQIEFGSGYTQLGSDTDGGYIDLEAGSWAVTLGILINPKIGQSFGTQNSCYAARFTLSTSPTTLQGNGVSWTGSNIILNTASTGAVTTRYPLFVNGVLRLTVTAKTRLYIFNLDSINGLFTSSICERASIAGNAENYIYAVRTN